MQNIARTSALAFFLFLLWIIFMADTGQHSIFFELVRSIPEGDKIGHVILYGTLTVLVNLALKSGPKQQGKRTLHGGTLLVALFALLEEISQAFFATRSCDWNDLSADVEGLMLGTLLLNMLKKGAAFRTMLQSWRG